MARTPWAPGAPALAAAARAIEAVASGGQSADAALAAAESTPERAAVRAITLGTLRWYLRLVPALEPLFSRPASVSTPLRSLLAAAAHQVEYSRNAAELTVHAAVDAARLLGEPKAAGFTNAVLRRFVTERGALFGTRGPQARGTHGAPGMAGGGGAAGLAHTGRTGAGRVQPAPPHDPAG